MGNVWETESRISGIPLYKRLTSYVFDPFAWGYGVLVSKNSWLGYFFA